MTKANKQKKNYIPIHLVEDPINGFSPITDIGAIQRDTEENPAPKPTPICRMALKAIAANIPLFKKAREIGLTEEKNYQAIITFALTQAIRLEQFKQMKKTEEQIPV